MAGEDQSNRIVVHRGPVAPATEAAEVTDLKKTIASMWLTIEAKDTEIARLNEKIEELVTALRESEQ